MANPPTQQTFDPTLSQGKMANGIYGVNSTGIGGGGTDSAIYNASNADQGTTSSWMNANDNIGQMNNLAGNVGGQIGYYQNMQGPTMQGAQLGSAPMASAAQNNANVFSQGAHIGPTQYAGNVGINQGQSNQDRALQMQNIQALQVQAAGGGPSVAGQQAQASSQAAIAGQMAATASQRGSSNASMGQRQAALQAAANQQATAQTAVQGRMQEQLNAQQQLGSVIGNQQGQDIGIAANQADLYQQTALANQAAGNQMNLAQAQMAQQNNQYNAGNALSQSGMNAQMAQQTALANQQMQGQYGVDQAQFNQATNLANMQGQLSQQGMNNQMVSNLFGQEGNLYGNAAQANINLAQSQQGAALGNNQMQNQEDQQDFQNAMQVTGMVESSMGSGMAMSDENEKEDIKPLSGMLNITGETNNAIKGADASTAIDTAADAKANKSGGGGGGGGSSGMMSSFMSMSDEREKEDVHDEDEGDIHAFLDALKAYSYRYKDKDNGKGKFVGVMAQDLEKTPIGKQAVIDTPKGKMVNYGQLAAAQMASTVLLNDEVHKLKLEVQNLKGGKR